MKKLLSIRYTAGAVNTAMLFLRIGLGVLMMNHGYQKISNFNGTAAHMPHLLGFSGAVNASLVIFAEFFCALFVILGLFTRLACVPIIVTMSVALYMVHHMRFFTEGEAAAIYLIGFITLIIIGPGRVSVDGMIGK